MPPLRRKHPPEEALLALIDSGRDERRLGEHLRTCPACRERFEELRRVRVLLRESAGYETVPQRDLATGALRRLQRRRSTIHNVNEFFGALFAIVRGLRTLLTADEGGPPERTQTQSTGDATRHG